MKGTRCRDCGHDQFHKVPDLPQDFDVCDRCCELHEPGDKVTIAEYLRNRLRRPRR